ncbi:hypothetical protein VP01_1019g5 [Puccinia sorghi]|uniref:Reverse transcriptase Ty1/copia-type domain-containing protein n=1 Tax=Puccinia sorghi TaxID=27349 RepID=A0A0L6VV66_9BASI|nr:hypothetical protein VP01_1019g5 [Puccinia sorghi]
MKVDDGLKHLHRRENFHLFLHCCAFLFSPLEEEIYIKTPEGLKQTTPYLKLVKSLYGLKQAPKNWYNTLTAWFEEINYNPSVSDVSFKKLFLARFPNSTSHSPHTLLGMNLTIYSDSIGLSQPGLIKKGLEMLNLSDSSAVSILSTFNQRPDLSHWRKVLHFWKYLKGTTDLGLLLRPKPENIIGSLVFWKSCPILWSSKKQQNITMSSTESEMNALLDGEQESQWLGFLIEELWKTKLAPTLFHIDNKGFLEKLKNFGSNSKTKHLDIKIKSLCEKFKNDNIKVALIPSAEMIADSLTKAAPHSTIKKLQDKCMSVLSPTTKEGC